MIKELLDGEDIFVIRDIFNQEQCNSLITLSEQSGYEEAPINTRLGQVIKKDVRNNSRFILDDHKLAGDLWQRAKDFVPQSIRHWSVVGLNERLRFYRYDPGQRFAPHFDGSFRRDNGEESLLTFMVFLNDDFTGGETNFYVINGRLKASVKPQLGMAVAFIHQQLHEGAPVETGRKYVLRTDVMYTID